MRQSQSQQPDEEQEALAEQLVLILHLIAYHMIKPSRQSIVFLCLCRYVMSWMVEFRHDTDRRETSLVTSWLPLSLSQSQPSKPAAAQ